MSQSWPRDDHRRLTLAPGDVTKGTDAAYVSLIEERTVEIETPAGGENLVIMPMGDAARTKLKALHSKLLHLHKVLLDDERREYEKINGPVPAAGQMLNLVMYDAHFDWLHRISGAIVKIDELMDSKESTIEDASDLTAALRLLFKPKAGDAETPFMARYKAVLQREPAAVLAHMETQKLLLTDA